ncbi:hypothetical protein ACFWM3_22005 [Gottfriedia sp. NPDC058432]|uniref:hypothetical protein n=1 Tax=Gottfriedia sp. NPDC058432 TaxID=3346497 RepID=UPI00365B7370
MKKLFKQAIVTAITAAILGSIIPIKSHAEEISKPISENNINQVNTQTSLPTPPIIQGRAVNDKYPQLPAPTVEAFSNDDGNGTGYLNVSWKPVEGITKYQVILFNGSIHSYWDVPADETTWTTKGKRMFPTLEQIEAGQVNFKRDNSGTDFLTDPSVLYKRAFEINGGLNYSENKSYYVRVTAVHSDGARPISYAVSSTIPLSTPEVTVSSVETYTKLKGSINLEWQPVIGATGYIIWMFNGKEYESFDIGNQTSWSTSNKGIWPTKDDILNGVNKLHKDGTGTDLPLNPSELYSLNNFNVENDLNYKIKVSAYNEYGNFSEHSTPANINLVSDFLEEYILLENNQYKLEIPQNIQNQLSSQAISSVNSYLSMMNDVINTNNIENVTEEGFTLELTDSQLSNKLEQQGLDPLDTLTDKKGVTKIKFHKWGMEIWMSQALVKTLGGIGIGGAGIMLGIVLPGIGVWAALIIGSIYNAYVLDRATALYVKQWYTGKRVVSKQ